MGLKPAQRLYDSVILSDVVRHARATPQAAVVGGDLLSSGIRYPGPAGIATRIDRFAQAIRIDAERGTRHITEYVWG
jgi:hypothetical protein